MLFLEATSYLEESLDIERNFKNIEKSKIKYNYFLIKYPYSRYSQQVRKNLIYINDLLSGKEMETGRFYTREGNFVAAITCFKKAIKKHDFSLFIPEAYYRLFKIYHMLGFYNLVNKYVKNINHKFKGTIWIDGLSIL